MAPPHAEEGASEHERHQALEQLEEWLELPMLVLGFVWLALLIVELVRGSSPLFDVLGTTIWLVFLLDFALRFSLAPRKARYLRHNGLTAVSLLLPALRVLRVARVVRLLRLSRTTRSLRLVRVVTSLNRGTRALRATMARRGFGYVMALTMLVVLTGAAGMYAFERDPVGGEGFRSYGDALWWTSMLVTPLGSEYWPRSAEGRILSLLLAVYGFAVFGYLTAALASFFVGRDAASDEAELAGAEQLEALREEVAALRRDLRRSGRG